MELNFNLIAFLKQYHIFSQNTFGPHPRTAGVLTHIRKELKEIEQEPDDLMEWVDLLLLAFDGCQRRGFTPEQIADGLIEKFSINKNRLWPDWRILPDDQAIEHEKN